MNAEFGISHISNPWWGAEGGKNDVKASENALFHYKSSKGTLSPD